MILPLHFCSERRRKKQTILLQKEGRKKGGKNGVTKKEKGAVVFFFSSQTNEFDLKRHAFLLTDHLLLHWRRYIYKKKPLEM
jgi:hypothetical protein